MSIPSDSLAEALARHQRGELQQAVQMYRDLLSTQPDDPEALHLLGVAALQCGQPRQAVELIERAIARNPSAAVFHGNLAEAYRACGEIQRAAACFQVALQLQPSAANVAANYGLLLMQLNRPAQAAALFRQALEHRPDFALAHNGLANACRAQGDVAQALTHFRRAVELNPQLPYAQTNLGQLLLDLGQTQEALPHCREAVRLQPDSAPMHNNLGNALRKLGHITEAKGCYTEALRLAPNLAMIHNNLGHVMQEEGKLDESARWFEQATQLEPGNDLFRLHLANVLIERGDFDAAEKQLRAILERQPRNLDVQFALGKLYYEQGRLEEAQTIFRALLEARPNHPALNELLGEVLMELNQQEQAVACFRTAVRGDPNFTPALAQLASHFRDQLPADEYESLQRLAAQANLPDAERAPLLFGLAQVCDARGDYAEAAKYLEQANALEYAVRQQRGQSYNHGAHVRFIDGLVDLFTLEFFERVRGFGVESERPIFIVGLPRSGTTLLEQILASHPRVFGAGELRLSREDFEELGGGSDGLSEARAFEILRGIEADRVQQLAHKHLERLNTLNATAARITDKMPDNYMYLGFLAMLFPKARFLHCRRDPRDIAVSCWSTQFRAIPWANDAQHLASRFTQYQRLMEHWQKVLPVEVLDVVYEELVEDLETAVRRILDFCGLEWEPACLEFHRTGRPVRTASVSQVRQPIYRRSVARWRNYEQSMQPLFASLGFAPETAASEGRG